MRGGSEALLTKEAGSVAAGRVATPEPSRAARWAPEPQDAWHNWSPPERGGGAQYHGTRGSTWMHTLLLALAWSLYTGIPSL
jgi:hypothetical protein